jgi:hypothetical protein
MDQRRRIPSIVGALSLVLASAFGAAAQTTLNVPADFPTISEAVAAAEKGATILVAPGVYEENLTLTETTGSGLIIRSTGGRSQTTLVYDADAESNENEAVVFFQRCSNSTQLVGFTIDGRDAARRAVLCNAESRPVLVDLAVKGCEYGVAAHRGSRPYVRNVNVDGSRTAGLFVSGGSADVKDSRFNGANQFGIFIGQASEEVRLLNVNVVGNGEVGLQVQESPFVYTNGIVADNGPTGMIINESSPVLTNLKVSGHREIGIVLEISSAKVVHCDIRDNEYGVVSSIEGAPQILGCVFANNASYHVGIEGDASPTIGGSLENANLFLGNPDKRVSHSSSQDVVATYNYWDLPCAPKKFFDIKGGGKLRRRPWAAGNLLRGFSDCTESRVYNRQFLNGRMDEEGNPLAPEIWQNMKKKDKKARAAQVLAKERGVEVPETSDEGSSTS